jgi:hypothetical protein
MSKLYRATVVLPFTYSARQLAQDAKGSRLAPHEWRAAAVAAQLPAHRAFLEAHGGRSRQIDADGGLVRFNIGGGWIGQETADEFVRVFEGCRGRLEDATEDALRCAMAGH